MKTMYNQRICVMHTAKFQELTDSSFGVLTTFSLLKQIRKKINFCSSITNIETCVNDQNSEYLKLPILIVLIARTFTVNVLLDEIFKT